MHQIRAKPSGNWKNGKNNNNNITSSRIHQKNHVSVNCRLQLEQQSAINEISETSTEDDIERKKQYQQYLETMPWTGDIIEIIITDIYEGIGTGNAGKIFSSIPAIHFADYSDFKSSLQTIFEESHEILLFNDLERCDKDAVVVAKFNKLSYSRCRIIAYFKKTKSGCFEDIDTGRKHIFDNSVLVKKAKSYALTKRAFASKFILDYSKLSDLIKVDDIVKVKVMGKNNNECFMASLLSTEVEPIKVDLEYLTRNDFELRNLRIGEQKLRFVGCEVLLAIGRVHVCENTEENKKIFRSLRAGIEEQLAKTGDAARYVPQHGEIILARQPENKRFYRCEALRLDINSAAVSSLDYGFSFEVDYENIIHMPENLKYPIVSHTCEIAFEDSTPTDCIDVEKTLEKLQKNPNITGNVEEIAGCECNYKILIAAEDVVLKTINK